MISKPYFQQLKGLVWDFFKQAADAKRGTRETQGQHSRLRLVGGDLLCRPPRWEGRQLVSLEPVCGRETTCEDTRRHQDRSGSLQQSTRKPPSAGRRRRIWLSPAVDPVAAISGPEEEDQDISPASTRRPPSAGRRRRIGTSLQHRPGGRHQRARGGQSGHISLASTPEAAVSGLGGRRHGKPRRHRELHFPLKQVDIAGVELCLNNPFFWGTFNFIFISHNVRDLYFYSTELCVTKRGKSMIMSFLISVTTFVAILVTCGCCCCVPCICSWCVKTHQFHHWRKSKDDSADKDCAF